MYLTVVSLGETSFARLALSSCWNTAIRETECNFSQIQLLGTRIVQYLLFTMFMFTAFSMVEQLYWLPVSARVQFNIPILVFKG